MFRKRYDSYLWTLKVTLIILGYPKIIYYTNNTVICNDKQNFNVFEKFSLPLTQSHGRDVTSVFSAPPPGKILRCVWCCAEWLYWALLGRQTPPPEVQLYVSEHKWVQWVQIWGIGWLFDQWYPSTFQKLLYKSIKAKTLYALLIELRSYA